MKTRWWVEDGSGRHGPFASRLIAERFAVALASSGKIKGQANIYRVDLEGEDDKGKEDSDE